MLSLPLSVRLPAAPGSTDPDPCAGAGDTRGGLICILKVDTKCCFVPSLLMFGQSTTQPQK